MNAEKVFLSAASKSGFANGKLFAGIYVDSHCHITDGDTCIMLEKSALSFDLKPGWYPKEKFPFLKLGCEPEVNEDAAELFKEAMNLDVKLEKLDASYWSEAKAVSVAQSDDITRHVLQTPWYNAVRNEVVATDGRRMMIVKMEDCAIPGCLYGLGIGNGSKISDVLVNALDCGGFVSHDEKTDLLLFVTGYMTAKWKMVAGTRPAYSQCIPKTNVGFNLNPAVIECCRSAVKGKATSVRISDDKFVAGEWSVDCKCYDSKNLETRLVLIVNPKFLIESFDFNRSLSFGFDGEHVKSCEDGEKRIWGPIMSVNNNRTSIVMHLKD